MRGNYRRVTANELAALQRAPGKVVEFLYPPDGADPPEDRFLDVDKSWHTLHYLLTGTRDVGHPPLCNVVLGGTELGVEDVGYGPARFLTPAEVKEVAGALSRITESSLRQRLNAETMKELDIEDAEEELGYVLSHYRVLVPFFQEADRAGDAMLLYIN